MWLTYWQTDRSTNRLTYRQKNCITMLNAQQNPPPTASCVGAKIYFFNQKYSQDWSKLNCRSLFRIVAPRRPKIGLSLKKKIVCVYVCMWLLPESPRWLVMRGRLGNQNKIIIYSYYTGLYFAEGSQSEVKICSSLEDA